MLHFMFTQADARNVSAVGIRISAQRRLRVCPRTTFARYDSGPVHDRLTFPVPTGACFSEPVAAAEKARAAVDDGTGMEPATLRAKLNERARSDILPCKYGARSNTLQRERSICNWDFGSNHTRLLCLFAFAI